MIVLPQNIIHVVQLIIEIPDNFMLTGKDFLFLEQKKQTLLGPRFATLVG